MDVCGVFHYVVDFFSFLLFILFIFLCRVWKMGLRGRHMRCKV